MTLFMWIKINKNRFSSYSRQYTSNYYYKSTRHEKHDNLSKKIITIDASEVLKIRNTYQKILKLPIASTENNFHSTNSSQKYSKNISEHYQKLVPYYFKNIWAYQKALNLSDRVNLQPFQHTRKGFWYFGVLIFCTTILQ